ncbi:MAG: prepilin-type N-terminal cleavage/methylation domain-containing protein [Actinomycetia bacterium]|nr:prepilin-type N-terminal cleavage/methylation domain-containing protein [Actinomycetes bacterium]
MLARIRKAMEEREGGFTLIELLVVIIIIGILAAIAIPVFLNQRAKATEAGMKSDLRTVANELETFFTDTQTYPATAAVAQASAGANVVITGGNSVKVSDPLTAMVYTRNAGGQYYCIRATNTKVSNVWGYASNAGGLALGLPIGCP